MKREYADLLRKADHIFIEELRRADPFDNVSQDFAVFLPVRSVETIDFMTARWVQLPYDFLDLVSRRIINRNFYPQVGPGRRIAQFTHG